MRTTLLGCLLDAARYNLARGAERVALFESGRAYLRRARPPARRAARRRVRGRAPAAGVRAAPDRLRSPAGPLRRAGWRGEPRDGATSSRSRASLEALAAPARRAGSRSSRPSEPFLHPGRAARGRSLGGDAAGWLGELHPLVCRDWDLDGGGGFELDLGAAGRPPRRSAPSATRTSPPIPAVLPGPRRRRRRGRRRRARSARRCVAGGGELLRSAEVFDLYRGEQVGEGQKEPRAAARVPRARSHPHRRGGRRAARGDQAALAEIGGSLRE